MGTIGCVLVIFGTAALAANVEHDNTWPSLGGVVGALIAISKSVIDAVAAPILLKPPTFWLNGASLKWKVVA